MSGGQHTCAVPGCDVAIRRRHLMCRHHWYRVPLSLRADVNDSWRSFKAAKRDKGALARYRLVRSAAIDAVASKSSPRATPAGAT